MYRHRLGLRIFACLGIAAVLGLTVVRLLAGEQRVAESLFTLFMIGGYAAVLFNVYAMQRVVERDNGE